MITVNTLQEVFSLWFSGVRGCTGYHSVSSARDPLERLRVCYARMEGLINGQNGVILAK